MNDLISRQMVLRCIKESRDNIDWGQSEDGDAFLHYTGALYRTIASEECLPSAERKGHWIKHGEPPWYVIECSECGAKWQMSGSWDANNFCGNCGARMVSEDD